MRSNKWAVSAQFARLGNRHIAQDDVEQTEVWGEVSRHGCRTRCNRPMGLAPGGPRVSQGEKISLLLVLSPTLVTGILPGARHFCFCTWMADPTNKHSKRRSPTDTGGGTRTLTAFCATLFQNAVGLSKQPNKSGCPKKVPDLKDKRVCQFHHSGNVSITSLDSRVSDGVQVSCHSPIMQRGSSSSD
jgi:hypothetical protein